MRSFLIKWFKKPAKRQKRSINFQEREVFTHLPGMEGILVYSPSPRMIREGSTKVEELALRKDRNGFALG